MDIKKEVDRVMSELNSADASRVNCRSSLYGALIIMRTTLIKSKEARVQLVQTGCIPLLLDLLTPPTATGKWLKTVDIVISILANMCLEEEEARRQVISRKGVSTIVEATICTEKESIHNRGVRAVANLIQHSSSTQEICSEIIDLEFHIFVAKRLLESKDKECKQTYLRAIRLLGQQKGQLNKLIENTRSIQGVACLLKEDDKKLKHRSLRVLCDFSAIRCCANLVEQILAANILEELVQAAESHDDEMSLFSLSIILKLCEHENIRPPLGAAGIISTFMRLLECKKSHINHISILNALCLCCYEAVNRHRLYQEKTLEFFMSILNSDQCHGEAGKFSILSDRILSCLVCFLYNDECFDKLLDLNLVTAVIGHLKRVCNLQIEHEDWNKEVEMILDERLNRATEITVDRNDSDVKFDDENKSNNVSPSSQSKNVHILQKGICDDDVNGDENTPVIDIPPNNLDLDQEIMDISMNDTEIIPPSGTQDSRHTFSIDSPTYQMEQHSWRLEDHTSGVTCKNYSEEFNKDDTLGLQSTLEGGGSKNSPYSPLSVGSSYYSPAYPSPAHSLGSSPRDSNFQTGSFYLGSQSPRSSPAWSPSNSLQSEDTWSNSDPGGRSPGNLMHSPNSQHGQFSPLINPYPASPPPMFPIEDRNISAESPLYISQVSNASNRTNDSQDDIFSEHPKHVFSDVMAQGKGRFLPVTENITGKSQKPIYSSSDDDEDDNDPEADLQKFDEDLKPKGKRLRKSENVRDGGNPAHACTLLPQTSTVNKVKTKSSDQKYEAELSVSSEKSVKLKICEENDNAMMSLPPTSGVPLMRLNSEPCMSMSSPPHLEVSSQDLVENEKRIEFEFRGKTKYPDTDAASLTQISKGRGFMKSGKKLFSKQCSFPGKGDKLASPLHSYGSMSPYRVQFELPFNSPSMSPFSRYSNSPYASPNPYQTRASQNVSSDDKDRNGQSKNISTSAPQSHSTNGASPCSTSVCEASRSPTSQSQDDTNLLSQTQDIQEPSTSKADAEKHNERLNRNKRKTEENIFVLLSRVSIKTDPSHYLPKYSVLSTLTKYIGVAHVPVQRCIRTLYRIFHNPHCFESVLLEQAPALIVQNLIMDQDGRFPSFLFKDQKGTEQIGLHAARKINFDDLFSCSQSSETPSDFELQIQFDFGGDAYSNMTNQRSFRSDIFQPNFLTRVKSVSHGMSRDSTSLSSSMTPEDRIKVRICTGINLMKAITSLALSRYGNGEMQRIWSRGTESEKLMCAISLLHMPIGCGRLHRRQMILKHNALQMVIPFLFFKEAPLVREGIVTSLSLLAHLLKIQKETPKISKLINTRTESKHPSSSSPESKMNTEENDSVNTSHASNGTEEKVYSSGKCNFERVSHKFNLNLIVDDGKRQERRVFHACKEILMKKSEVFAAMLGGSYAEANKVDIEFSDVSLSGFEYVLHFFHGCESGCAVIDSLSLVCSDALNCDSNSGDMHSLQHGTTDTDMEHEKPTETENVLADNIGSTKSQRTQCDTSSIESPMGATDEIEIFDSQATTSQSVVLLEENGNKASNLNDIKQTESEESLVNINNKPSTSSVASTENESSSSDVNQKTQQIDAILDKCIDVMMVADRFLIHNLIQYLTSVLSHTCLYTRTVMDIICLASTYKLTGLATDCVVEVLTSHTSHKDKAELFQILGLELDCDTKIMLIDILTNIFTNNAECS